MSIPRTLGSFVLICLFSLFSAAQGAPDNSGVTTTTAPAAAAQAPEQPQKELPPDTKAPAPVANAPASATPGTAQPTAAVTPRPHYIASGTDVRATLDTPLSTKTTRVGDRFTATVSSPVNDTNGNIIVPVGSKLNGQISEATDEKLADAIKDMGHLSLRFTDIQLPTGTVIPINATLISIHTTKPSAGSGTRETQPTAIGANAGMAGGFGPPLRGLAVGNLAGGGYVLATKGKKVDLPAECGLRLKVDGTTPVP